MTIPMRPPARRANARALAVAVCVATLLCAAGTAQARGDDAPAPGGTVALSRDWEWPVRPFRLERPFVAPAHEYGPGHRGIDMAPLGDDTVRAPAPGVVAFSGQVAGRGVVTIDHGDGLVSTLEPVASDLAAGAVVAAGTAVGRLATGGHAAAGTLHLGVRLDGAYINPLVLLGGVPRAVLLPCC